MKFMMIAAAALCVAFAGCNKQETKVEAPKAPATQKAVQDTKAAAQKTAEAAKAGAQKTAEAAKETATKAVDAVKKAATDAKPAAPAAK